MYVFGQNLSTKNWFVDGWLLDEWNWKSIQTINLLGKL